MGLVERLVGGRSGLKQQRESLDLPDPRAEQEADPGSELPGESKLGDQDEVGRVEDRPCRMSRGELRRIDDRNGHGGTNARAVGVE